MSILKDKIFKGLSYTSRDYESIMADMIQVLRDGGIYKGGFNLSEADPMFIELSLMAAHTDILNYMIDYRILENYMSTAKERASLIRIANSDGYKIRSFRPACAKYEALPEMEGTKELEFMEQFKPSDSGRLGWVYVGSSQTIYGTSRDLQFVQGVVITYSFIGDRLDNNSKTLIIDTAQIAIGAAIEGVRTSRLMVNEVEWTEVDSVLGKSGTIYELNVDPTGTTYIRFPRDLIVGDYKNSAFKLEYIVTAGAEVLLAPNYIDRTTIGPALTLTLTDNTFARGSDPATAEEIKEGYKLYKYSGDSLVSLADVKNYIMNIQKVIPNVTKCLVIDGSLDTDGQQGNDNFFGPGEFGIYVLKDNNGFPTSEELTNLETEINKRKPMGTKLLLANEVATDTPVEVKDIYVKLNKLPNNTTQSDAIKDLIIKYIAAKPFGVLLNAYELISIIYRSGITNIYDSGLTVELGELDDVIDYDKIEYLFDNATQAVGSALRTTRDKIIGELYV